MDGGSMNRSLFRLGLYTVLALALAAANAYAQGSTTSTISGRVVDSSGGVLPGATVTAKHLATTRESSTCLLYTSDAADEL